MMSSRKMMRRTRRNTLVTQIKKGLQDIGPVLSPFWSMGCDLRGSMDPSPLILRDCSSPTYSLRRLGSPPTTTSPKSIGGCSMSSPPKLSLRKRRMGRTICPQYSLLWTFKISCTSRTSN